MPTALVTRIDLDLLWPPLLEKMLDLAAACQDGGKDYFAISGYRSVENQQRLYEQGRTTPGARVTNARGGSSAHNFGLAVDFALDGNTKLAGLQPDWANNAGQYALLASEGAKLGLQVGVPGLADPGHVQVPCSRVFGMSERAVLLKCHGLYLQSRNIKDVWAWLDERAAW